MNFNICVVQPPGYIHSAAFDELAELVFHGLQDAGHNVSAIGNYIKPDTRNIIVGCHLLGPEYLDQLPKDTIILNTEQIYNDEVGWSETILKYAAKFELWDYNSRNLEHILQSPSARVKLLPIGFHPALRRIPKPPVQDIDVLFYGSLNDRRRRVIQGIQDAGIKIEVLMGVYGNERDRMIARSKVILNVHHYPTFIFEIVRVFYLMINSKAVVCEVGPDTTISAMYLDGIRSSPYDRLVETCQELVADDQLRANIEARAFDTIKRFPQGQLMATMLAHPPQRRRVMPNSPAGGGAMTGPG